MKTALLYALLVGLPVLGLLGVLQVGRLVEAPPAVGGWWAYTSAPAGVSACVPAEGVFEIVQSGTYAVVAMPGRPDVQARLRRGVLQTAPSADTGCGGPLRVEARVGQDVAERLEGTMSGATFAAVRTAAPQTTPASAH